MSPSTKRAALPNDGPAMMQQFVLAQLCEQAAAAARTGRLEEAERYYRCALELDEDNADLWALLGTVVQGDRVRAACARRALALSPGHRLAQALLAGEVPRPGEPRDGDVEPAPPARLPTAVAPRPLPLDPVLEEPLRASTSPVADKSSSEADSFFLPSPHLRPAEPYASTPFWTRLPWPAIDLRALGNKRRPRPSAAVGAASSRARRPIAFALPRLSFPLTRQVRIRLIILAGLLLVAAVNLGLAALYENKYAGRIVPGVRIGGVGMGGLAPAEVEEVLRSQVAATLQRPILLEYEGRYWAFTAAEIGLRFLVAEAVQEAAGLGHRASAWDSWRERARAGLGGIEVPLRVEVQRSRRQAVLEQIAADVDRPAIPPDVSWEQGSWLISPGQDGRHVVRDEALDRMLGALTTVVNGDSPAGDAPLIVALPVVTESAALAPDDLERLRGELALAAQPLTVRCAGYAWDLTTADIATWLRVKLAPPAVEADALALRGFLSDAESIVAIPMRRPRMETVDGRVTVFDVGSDGLALNIETSLAQLRDVIERRLQGEVVEGVDLVVQVVPAGQDALMAEMGVRELIGEGHSSFRDSAWARVNNIVVGGQELNGRIVAPDEVFSLNDALEPVSGEKGYVMSEIIVGGGVGYGMGGGLCQLATTLYRAVLHTGLEVVERHAHAWRLDWYEQDSPPGFDATIMIGEVDLRFRNNTGHYILIQVETDAEAAWQVVRIYGTSPGWEVSISEPVRDSNGLYFRRTVTTADGEVLIDETVYSHY